MSTPTDFLYAYLLYKRPYKAILHILKIDFDPISQGWPQNENCHHHIPDNSSFDLTGHKP